MKKPLDTWGRELLASLVERATSSPRRRQHLNLHLDHSDSCQRLLNAICADSYIRPHRHVLDPKDELLIVLQGEVVCWYFDDSGTVVDAVRMEAGGEFFGVTIHAHQWHTITACDAGAVILEVKAGPFDPLTAKLMAPWAPEEGSPGAPAYLKWLNQQLPLWQEAR